MQFGAIRSHMTRSTVHKERMKLFRQALSDEAEAAGHLNDEVLVVENTNSLTTTNIQSPDNNDKQCGFIDDNVRTAELLYALNMVYNCASFNSLNECGSLFKKMFPDSKIASSITLARTKATYIVKFGVAPFVKEKLVADLSLVEIDRMTLLMKNKKELEATIIHLNQEAGVKYKKAEKKRDFKLLTEGNVLREAAKAKQAELTEIESEIRAKKSKSA